MKKISVRRTDTSFDIQTTRKMAQSHLDMAAEGKVQPQGLKRGNEHSAASSSSDNAKKSGVARTVNPLPGILYDRDVVAHDRPLSPAFCCQHQDRSTLLHVTPFLEVQRALGKEVEMHKSRTNQSGPTYQGDRTCAAHPSGPRVQMPTWDLQPRL